MIEFASVARSSILAAATAEATPRFVVSGDVVTMNRGREVVRGGRLCIQGQTIVAVLRAGEPPPVAFEHAAQVQTNGTIYPGLIDLHNHLPYNMIPLWQVDRRFDNRKEWQNIVDYYPAVTAPFKLLNEHPTDPDYVRAIVRYAECKGLVGGITTGHGMSLTNKTLYEGLIRNIEQPLDPGLPVVKSYTADFPAEKLAEMLDWTKQGKPYIYHLSEGVGAYGEKWFRQLQGAEGGLNDHLICIHCVGIPTDGWNAMKQLAGIVWSPTSNLLLYGRTCNVREAADRGISVAIGVDWAPSGCKNILGELKVARAVSSHMGGVLSEADIVAGATSVPAAMIGWSNLLGSLASGKRADFLVLEGTGGDPYAKLIDARETSIRAVVIDGRVRLGEANGLVIADPLSSESVSIGGKSYVVDLAEPGDSTVGGMKLAEAVVKLQYGLAHLPNFEGDAAGLVLAGEPSENISLRLEDEMNVESLTSILLRDDKLPAKAMSLEPMSAVDDPHFKKAMQKSINMPDYAKEAFDG